MEYLAIIGIVIFIGFFVIRTGKRPANCTCKHYNPVSMGPVNKCPAHKHMMKYDGGLKC